MVALNADKELQEWIKEAEYLQVQNDLGRKENVGISSEIEKHPTEYCENDISIHHHTFRLYLSLFWTHHWRIIIINAY